MRARLTFGISLLLLLSISLKAQIQNPIIFSSVETDSLLEIRFRFLPQPEYGQSSQLQITLKAFSVRLNGRGSKAPTISPIPNRHVPPTRENKMIIPEQKSFMEWSLSVSSHAYLIMPDTVAIWKMPVKAGDSLKLTLPVTPQGVGEFDFILSEKGIVQNALRFQVTLVIDESGRTIYLGKYPPPFANPLNAHPFCFGEKLDVRLPGQALPRGLAWLEPFDIQLSIQPTLRVGASSLAEATIFCMTDQIKQIQYEIVATANLKIDSISPSQGENPGSMQKFRNRFYITPLKAGRSFLSFQVFGLLSRSRHSDIAGSKMPLHLIFDNNGDLLYMGAIDPFAVGFAPGNPAYQKIDSLIEFKEATFDRSTFRSMPDYALDRKDEQRVTDSAKLENLRDSMERQQIR